MKKKIAIIGGGNSSEADVAKKSAVQLLDMMDKTKYDLFLVSIIGNKWNVIIGKEKIPINKSDFSILYNNKKIRFDCVYITIHGTPGEDGRLQSYFELMNIPYTSCGVFVSNITFNKYACKIFLNEYKIKSAKAVLVRKNDKIIVDDIIMKTGLPCFIKPNNGGSSFGVSKAGNKKDILPGIKKALEHDNEVIIEEFIKGREFTNGVYMGKNGIKVLPITEIISKNEYFDVNAKYYGESREVTPAELESKLEKKCKKITANVYQVLNCKGVVRIDYILSGNDFYMLEINTVPGMTSASIIPQQIKAEGLVTKDVFTEIIENAISEFKNKEIR